MIYYITGANGFIGKHVCMYLFEKGLPYRKISRPFAEPVFWDKTEEFTLIHLSAYGNHYNQKDYFNIIESNIIDLAKILIVAKHRNCKKFYNISTSSVHLPVQTMYSTSKKFGELMVESCNDPRFVNIRPYSVYGPGEAEHRFIPTVIRALHTGEKIKLDHAATHDWIHVEDFVNAMFNGHTEIGTGESYLNWQIVETLERIADKRLRFERASLRNYDTKKWEALLPVPHRSLFDGLKQTYEYFTRKNNFYK